MTDTRPIPLRDLSLSILNPRRDGGDDGIAELAESIATAGMMHPLAVLDVAGAKGVVAGGRRLRALQLLAEEGRLPHDHAVDCLLTEDRDQAMVWAGAENAARRDLSPADEVESYAAMARRGLDPRAIAIAWGVHERRVRQRLKLAALAPAAMAALRAGEISLDQAAAITAATDATTAEDLLGYARQGQSASMIRHRANTRPRVTDRRVVAVGLDAYRAAGGTVTADLFSDLVTVDDPKLLDDLFADHVNELARQAREVDGWAWAEFLPDEWMPWLSGKGCTQIHGEQPVTLSEADAAEMARLLARSESDPDGGLTEAEDERLDDLVHAADQLDFSPRQRAVAGGWFIIDRAGVVQSSFGWVRPADMAAAQRAGVIAAPQDKAPGADAAPADDGPDLSAALMADLRAIDLHAVQAAMAGGNPDLFDLWEMAMCGASIRARRALGLHVTPPVATPQTQAGFTPSADLAEEPDELPGDTLAEQLQSWRMMPLSQRFRWRMAGLGRLLHRIPYDPFWQDLRAMDTFDPRAIWTPTRAGYFDRLRSAQLDDHHAAMFALDPDSPAQRAFAAKKKAEKAILLDMIHNADTTQRRGYPHCDEAALRRLDTFFPEVTK